jgi:hypothetical protein
VLSANANTTLSAKPVSFFSSLDLLTPANTAGQLCKAWVNFNGTGTVAIRASYNVSSITDNGTGDYTVNFTTAMVDANYSAIASSNSTFTAGYPTPFVAGYAANFVSVIIGKNATSNDDAATVSVAIFR